MNPKMPFLRSTLVLTVGFAFTACQDASLPSQPDGPTMPGPSAAFVDASTSGAEGFFWQPPIVQDAVGENNRDLSPVVVVCESENLREEKFCDADPNTVTGAPYEDSLATLETTLSKKKEDRYEATFESDEFSELGVGDVVRIFAFRGDPLSGEEPAGWFDVELTDPDTKSKGNKKLTDDDGDGTLELQLGSSLPAAFRMSDALFCSQESIDDGFCFVGTFSNDEGGSGSSENGFVALDVDPDFIPEEKVAVGVDEVTFILERVARSDAEGEGCLDGITDFPLQERDLCVRGATAPDMMEFPFKADGNGDSRVTLGMCFDDAGLSQTEEEQFQGWDADEIEIQGDPVTVRTPLRGVAAPSELDCTDFDLAALDDGPLMRYARGGLESLRDFFVGPAVALNTGFGHSVMTFSRIVYARSLVLTDLTGDLEAAPGDVVDVSVRVTRPPNTSGDHHFDSEAGSAPTSDYPEDDLFPDNLDPGPLDDASAVADVGVNGVELIVEVSEGSVDADATPTETTVTTTTVGTDDGVATFDVTMPAEPSSNTVAVTVTGPALGSPLEIPIDLQGPVIENLAPATDLAVGRGFIFRGSGEGNPPRSILFDASDPDNDITSVVVEAVDEDGNSFSLNVAPDATSGGSKIVDPDGSLLIDAPAPPDTFYTTTITVEDADDLQATETILYTLDTTQPTINPTNVPPSAFSTVASSATFTVEGEITDANDLTEAIVGVFEAGDDAVCGTGDDLSLDEGSGAGEVDDRDQSVLGSPNPFSVDFTIQKPSDLGEPDRTYCFIVTAVDEALDNTGALDGNTAEEIVAETVVTWATATEQ